MEPCKKELIETNILRSLVTVRISTEETNKLKYTHLFMLINPNYFQTTGVICGGSTEERTVNGGSGMGNWWQWNGKQG